MLPSVAGVLWFFAALAKAGPVMALVDPHPPRLENLRAIQYDYSSSGGQVAVVWSVEDGQFDSFSVELDGVPQKQVPGTARGVRFDQLPLGPHQVVVKGQWPGGTAEAPVDHEVLETSPVEPPVPWNCLFFGYDLQSASGLLQVAWHVPERDFDPYLEFEVEVNLGGAKRLFYRLDAPDDAVTFEGVPEGQWDVLVTGVTRSYASAPAKVRCRAMGLPSPTGLRIEAGCWDVKGAARVFYQVLRGTSYSFVAAWAALSTDVGENKWSFLGYYPPSPQEVLLTGLPEGQVTVELALARFEPGADGPFAISNLPDGPGSHARAETFIHCGGPNQFRRGDVVADGSVNITDPVYILRFLFLGGPDYPCQAAADVDDSGAVDISDGVRLLGYLFVSGPLPADPGPLACGPDPTPTEGEDCVYGACSQP